MLFIHPLVQACLILLALYNLRLGFTRFRFNHLGAKTAFQWKKHVNNGLVVTIGMAAGAGVGLFMTWYKWSAPGGTGWHFSNAMIILFFLAFSLVTGLYMDRNKARRKALPLLHGISGLAVALLALCQAATGWDMVSNFL
jgi:hypothetical protein